MEEDEVRAITQELNSLATRFGITEYVFMHVSPTEYGHISGGNPPGPIPAPRVLGLIDTIRLVVMTRLVRAMNEEDAQRKHKKKRKGEK